MSASIRASMRTIPVMIQQDSLNRLDNTTGIVGRHVCVHRALCRTAEGKRVHRALCRTAEGKRARQDGRRKSCGGLLRLAADEHPRLCPADAPRTQVRHREYSSPYGDIRTGRARRTSKHWARQHDCLLSRLAPATELRQRGHGTEGGRVSPTPSSLPPPAKSSSRKGKWLYFDYLLLVQILSKRY